MRSEGLETTKGREGFSVKDGELTSGNKSHHRREAESHICRNFEYVPWTFFSLEIIFNQNLHRIMKFIKSQVRADIRLIICASQGSSVICLVTIASLSRKLNAGVSRLRDDCFFPQRTQARGSPALKSLTQWDYKVEGATEALGWPSILQAATRE